MCDGTADRFNGGEPVIVICPRVGESGPGEKIQNVEISLVEVVGVVTKSGGCHDKRDLHQVLIEFIRRSQQPGVRIFRHDGAAVAFDGAVADGDLNDVLIRFRIYIEKREQKQKPD